MSSRSRCPGAVVVDMGGGGKGRASGAEARERWPAEGTMGEPKLTVVAGVEGV